MSNVLFPAFAGVAWPLKLSPAWNTKVLPTASGRETRAAFQAMPLWSITLTFEYLSRADYLAMSGFFMNMRGMWDTFLLDAGSDSIATDTAFAVGDGTTKNFQLGRLMGTFAEVVQNVGVLSAIKAAGSVVAPSGYTVGATGIVSFTVAPANGAVLTWSGSYYYRCRLDQDAADFEEFMHHFYSLKTLKLKGSPGNKLL
ncbi:MAG: DUF2460 domain-containing protein [Rhodoferax sp.]|nr:DUF2460 domain-containing protein [Rhodoferax sp.]MDP3650527.1 DUF2460 domain-containing protein [Rhodoferax sp.]